MASPGTPASRVQQTTRRFATRLVTVRTRNDALVTTPDHRFAKVGAGWTPALSLAIGDRIHSLSSGDGAEVVAIDVRDVPPTAVYNLTVARSRTYFVGLGDLLVHNVDCADRPNPDPFDAARRAPHADPPRRPPQDNGRRNVPNFNDTGSRQNCSHCTLGGLSDYDKVSTFVHDHKYDEAARVVRSEILARARQLGLVSDVTPNPAHFPPPVEGRRRAEPDAQQVQGAAEDFMRQSSSNSFVMLIKGHPDSPMAHAMLAIRGPDGSISYIDLQVNPPAVYDKLNPGIVDIEVVPTDVDWRFNRQLYRVAQQPNRNEPSSGWPATIGARF